MLVINNAGNLQIILFKCCTSVGYEMDVVALILKGKHNYKNSSVMPSYQFFLV